MALPFTIGLQSGEPLHDQIVYAVRRAVAARQLRAGDAFPSVRMLSQELKINPNTAHKAVATLVDAGFLEVRHGVGTVVTSGPRQSDDVREQILDADTQRLVVDAKAAGLSLRSVVAAVRRHWTGMMRRAS
jgi:GntR family transcriptional regulator